MLPLAAYGQALPGQVDRDAQRIFEQQQQQARQRADQFEQERQRPPSGEEIRPPEAPADSGSGCAAIHDVQLVGVTRYAPHTFSETLAGLRGECVNVKAINAALRTITDRYVHDGYVTSRAFVGPQNLKDGTLTITVIEGRVGGIKPDSTDGPHYGPGEVSAAFPTGSGKVLNLRALEQGVDQLARMSKGDPTIDIAPGDTPGTSMVLVKRRPLARWIRPSVSVSNDGSAATGRLQGTATLDVDSLLGLADAWSLYASRDLVQDPQRGSRAYGGFLSLPRGWWTLSLSGGASDYHSVLSGNGLSFATRGQTWNASASLDRMLHRDAKSKLSVSAGLAAIDTQNFIQGIQLRTSSYRIVTARIDAHWQRKLGTSVLSANGGYARGLGILGAQTVDTGPGGATGQFNMLSGDAALQSRFMVGPTKFFNSAMVRWQWGFDNLFPAQRFSLGGSSTVRGFRDDGISGRSGALLREQLGFGIADLARRKPALATSLSGYLAYDFGVIRPNGYDPYERGVLHSASAGIRAQARHVQADVALSVPVSAPSWVHHKTTELLANVRILL